MKKLKMTAQTMTFEEGCNKYLEYCRQRNLREGTIGHYKQSYTQFYKYFDPKMPIEDINETTYKNYESTLNNDVSINSYLRDLITTLHFFMNESKQYRKATKKELRNLLWDKLPDVLSDTQKEYKIGSLLASLKRQEIIYPNSTNQQKSYWILK